MEDPSSSFMLNVHNKNNEDKPATLFGVLDLYPKEKLRCKISKSLYGLILKQKILIG